MPLVRRLRAAAVALAPALALAFAGGAPPAGAQVPADVQVPGPSPTQGACRADNVSWVMGGGLCLPIRSFAPRRVPPGPVLVVFLHGNTWGPRAPVDDDLASFAADIARARGVVAVTMTRPGHTAIDGRPADGMFRPQLLPDSPDAPAVADAIATLRRHYGARRVVVVGFSGGSRLIARMVQNRIGRFDAALLYACPCEDPAEEIAEAVPEGDAAYPQPLSLTVITGTRDWGTRGGPAFVRVLAARRVAASFRPLRNQAHLFDDHAWSVLKPTLLRFIRG